MGVKVHDARLVAMMNIHGIRRILTFNTDDFLRFSVYFPRGLAEWLLGLVEKGTFIDPSEAVFVMLQEAQELEPHHDLRRELLVRMLQAAEDPRPPIPGEEVFKLLREKRISSPEPAVWEKHKPVSA
jgi:antitoxin ParD1/3/4